MGEPRRMQVFPVGLALPVEARWPRTEVVPQVEVTVEDLVLGLVGQVLVEVATALPSLMMRILELQAPSPREQLIYNAWEQARPSGTSQVPSVLRMGSVHKRGCGSYCHCDRRSSH